MREDPKFWSKRLHPEDAPRVYKELASMIERGEGATEYRFRHRRGHYLWIQDTFKVIRDNEGKPKELVGSWADISDRKQIEAELQRVAGDVERRNRFIRETFGRYLTDEVVDTLLELPGSLHIGGEKRKVTMMMADLRGFTSLSERLAPKWVVAILNRYLSTMVKVIKQYGGTIDEFIGDAIFVLFGAPVWREDDAQRAVACAVAMQLAMTSVNEQNKEEDLPDLEMGIGIHTGQVVVGNIGSLERMKYGVVGSHVNLSLPHPVLHHGRADSGLGGHPARGRPDAQDRKADGDQSKGIRTARHRLRSGRELAGRTSSRLSKRERHSSPSPRKFPLGISWRKEVSSTKKCSREV